jgi:hypothetical protein
VAIWLRSFLSLLGVLGVVAATLKGADSPSRQFREERPNLFGFAIAFVILGSISNLWETVRRHLRERQEGLYGKVHAALVPLYRHTYGLSRNERDWTLQHAPAILASPIQKDRKFVGCLAVDCPTELLESLFNTEDAREQIYDAVQVIAGFIP